MKEQDNALRENYKLGDEAEARLSAMIKKDKDH